MLEIPTGHYSLSTDTHSESRLLVLAYPYLHRVPSIKNRLERIQITALLWDALFHSNEATKTQRVHKSAGCACTVCTDVLAYMLDVFLVFGLDSPGHQT